MTDFLTWVWSHLWGKALISFTVGIASGLVLNSMRDPNFIPWWSGHAPMLPVTLGWFVWSWWWARYYGRRKE